MSQARDKATKSVLEAELQTIDEGISKKKAELNSLMVDVKAAKIRRGLAERRATEAQAKYDRQETDYRKREKELKTQLETVAKDYLDFQTDYESNKLVLTTTLDELHAAIKAAKRELKEREQYLKEQEALIHTTLQDGEARIADLDYQVKQILKQQQEVLLEGEVLNTARTNAQLEVTALIDKRHKLEEIYAEATARYKASLQDLYLQIENQTAKYKAQLATSKQLVERLSAKERELDAKEQSLQEKEENLAKEHRLIESRKRLYS